LSYGRAGRTPSTHSRSTSTSLCQIWTRPTRSSPPQAGPCSKTMPDIESMPIPLDTRSASTAIHPRRRGERRWAAWSTTASVRVRWRVSTKASSARRSGSKTHPSASWSTWVTTNSLTWRFSMPSSQRLVGNPACPAQLHVDYRFTVDDERPHYQTPAGKAAMKRAEELGAIHIRVTVYADPAGHPSCFLTNQGRHSRDCRDNQPASCMS